VIHPDNLRYVILHNHHEELVIPRLQRELLIHYGTVLEITECSTYSLQKEYIKRWYQEPRSRWDLVLILWNMEDRYSIEQNADFPFVEVHRIENFSDASSLVQNLRIDPTIMDWKQWSKIVPPAVAPLREQLAEYAHAAWSGWMKYMLPLLELAHEKPDGTWELTQLGIMTTHYVVNGYPEPILLRWIRQMTTDYADLSENEKFSDRNEADRMLAIMRKAEEDANPLRTIPTAPTGSSDSH
jgi:hypothetical protein